MYEGEYFVFGINFPWSRKVYGEEIHEDSCAVYRKRNQLLVPVGEDTWMWERDSTDRPPQIREVLEKLIALKVDRVFTCSIPYPRNTLWGLINSYAPDDWDYETDRYPDAIVYHPISEMVSEVLTEHGIRTVELDEKELQQTL